MAAETKQDTALKSRSEGAACPKQAVTTDEVAAARALLRSDLSRLDTSSGPERMRAGTTIAAAYAETGVHGLAVFAPEMADDFGQKIESFLLSFREGGRHYPGLDTEGMTPPEEAVAIMARLNAQNEHNDTVGRGQGEKRGGGADAGGGELHAQLRNAPLDTGAVSAKQPENVAGTVSGSRQIPLSHFWGVCQERDFHCRLSGEKAPGEMGDAVCSGWHASGVIIMAIRSIAVVSFGFYRCV